MALNCSNENDLNFLLEENTCFWPTLVSGIAALPLLKCVFYALFYNIFYLKRRYMVSIICCNIIHKNTNFFFSVLSSKLNYKCLQVVLGTQRVNTIKDFHFQRQNRLCVFNFRQITWNHYFTRNNTFSLLLLLLLLFLLLICYWN